MTAQRPVSLARRIMPAVALAGAGAGMLALLDDPTSTLSASGAGLSTELVTRAGSATATTVPTAPTSTLPTSTSKSTAAAPGATTPTSTVPSTPTCSGSPTVGPSIDNEFGTVQVEAVLDADGKVCAVQAVRTPTGGKSSRINQRAVPVLNTRALDAGDASFQMVSGATITSEGYQASLQAILDAR